jgi:hypothetical protein
VTQTSTAASFRVFLPFIVRGEVSSRPRR